MASEHTGTEPEETPVPTLNMMGTEAFEACITSALGEGAGSEDHVLLELDVVRADDIEHRFGSEAAAALRKLLAAHLHDVLGGEAPVCDAGHCGLVALLLGTSCEQGSELAHRILQRVEDERFSWHQHPFRLGAHVGVVQLGAAPALPAQWRQLSRDVSEYALQLGGDGVQLLAYGEQALAHLRGESAWHEHISQIIA